MCRTEFEQSPLMGTYQPTFIVHDMDFIESERILEIIKSELDIQAVIQENQMGS